VMYESFGTMPLLFWCRSSSPKTCPQPPHLLQIPTCLTPLPVLFFFFFFFFFLASSEDTASLSAIDSSERQKTSSQKQQRTKNQKRVYVLKCDILREANFCQWPLTGGNLTADKWALNSGVRKEGGVHFYFIISVFKRGYFKTSVVKWSEVHCKGLNPSWVTALLDNN
jgi:hypothetical protein